MPTQLSDIAFRAAEDYINNILSGLLTNGLRDLLEDVSHNNASGCNLQKIT